MHRALTNIDPYGQKCKFSKIQDGGGRRLEFRKMFIVSANMKQFSPNLNNMHMTLTNSDYRPLGSICKFSKIQDGVGRHLEFRKMLIVCANTKQFSPNFNSMYTALTNIDP
jgi:hypothetical protein